MAPLATPRILQRNNSIKELDNFAENANAMNRMILRHLSISEAYQPPAFKIGGMLEEEEEGDNGSLPIFDCPNGIDVGELAIFAMDSDSMHSEEEDPAPIMWMGISPPGSSALARRRALRKQESDESADSSPKVVRHGRSPPKVPSAMF
jgi:hypothetical protein